MNKHSVEFNGQTFTRNSKTRKYSHAVLVMLSFEKALAEARAPIRHLSTLKSDYRYYQSPGAYIDYDGSPYPGMNPDEMAHGFLAKFPTFQSYIDHEIEMRVARVMRRAEKGMYGVYAAWSWHSRADLAEKKASQILGRGKDVDDVVIVPATIN